MRKLAMLAALCLGFIVPVASAQTSFPNKPVRVIVPYPPGGGTDTIARVVTNKLAEVWGQPVVVENRPGAGGNIGTAAGANAAPDGYTVTMIIHSSIAVNPYMYKDVGFDPMNDLAPIGRVSSTPYVMVANASVPAKNLKELIALSKSKPGTLAYASSASGPQAVGELFKAETGADMLHVPFKGSAPALLTLLSGDVQLMFAAPSSVRDHVQSGKLHVLGLFGQERSDVLPSAVSVQDQGFPQFADISEWYGFAVPAKTPKEIVTALNTGLIKAMEDPAVQKAIKDQGMEPSPSSPDELAQQMRRDYERWASVLKDAKME